MEQSTGLLRTMRWDSEEGFVLPTGTVTLLLADVEGSVRAWEQDPAAMASAMARFGDLVTETVGHRGGVLPRSQGEGDSFVAAFARASDAVGCALDIQLALRDETLRVRMAVHTGEAEVKEGTEYIGGTINRCARLRDAAHGGQVLVSGAAHDLVADHLPDGVSLEDLGSHRLRDLHRPERVFQLIHADLPAQFPALRTLEEFPNNLPVQLTSFVGRMRELREAGELVRDNRLVTLTGAGGSGKTRLALQVAAEAMERFDEGVWVCDLGPVSDPAAVPQALASVLGLESELDGDAIKAMAARFRNRRVLVVLDNCEHMIGACAVLAEQMLTSCPNLHVMATSREPLAVAGEVNFRVPSLELPSTDGPQQIEALRACEAVRLFIERARQARPNFRVDDENAPAVAQICSRLDGIPLAIELAAARVRMMTADQIAAGLDDRFRLLGAGPRTAVPRQQTLRASVDWSHDLLTDAERIVFRRLSVFVGGFDLDAAERVCAGEGIEPLAVFGVVTALVDRSLVQVIEARPGDRYRLLETLREYAAERLDTAGEQEAARSRHRDWYLDLAETATSLKETGAEQGEWMRRLDIDADNISAAFRYMDRTDDGEKLARMLIALNLTIGHRRLGIHTVRRWADRALALTEGTPAAVRALALEAAAWAAWHVSDGERLLPLASESLDVWRGLNEPDHLAWATFLVAWGRWYSDDHAGGRALMEEAAAIAERGDCRFEQGWVLFWLASMRSAAGDIEGAATDLEESVGLARRHGFDGMLRAAERELAVESRLVRGDITGARDVFARIVEAARRDGDWSNLGHSLEFLGEALVLLADYEAAVRAADEAHELFRRTGVGMGTSPLLRGRLALAQGDYTTAIRAFEEVLGDEELQSDTFYRLGIQSQIAVAEVGLGELESARRRLDESTIDLHRPGLEKFLARRLFVDASLARAEGDPGRSEALAFELLQIVTKRGDRLVGSRCLELLGGLAAQQESHTEAARLLAAADALRRDIGFVRPPAESAGWESDVALARERLGAEAFESAWAGGTSMSWGEAVAYAFRGRGERKRPSSGWASLSPTELDVARLVAEGLTNPQIAERLFVAMSTVKTHLEHIFHKLGISKRSELAAEVTRRQQ